jgi:hypothetical protein
MSIKRPIHWFACGCLVIVALSFSEQTLRGQYRSDPANPRPKIDIDKINDNFRNWQRDEEQEHNFAPSFQLHDMPDPPQPAAKKSRNPLGKFTQAALVVVGLMGGLVGLWPAGRWFLCWQCSGDPRKAQNEAARGVNQPAAAEKAN